MFWLFLLFWFTLSWAESAVSPAEKKCYFGFDMAKNVNFKLSGDEFFMMFSTICGNRFGDIHETFILGITMTVAHHTLIWNLTLNPLNTFTKLGKFKALFWNQLKPTAQMLRIYLIYYRMNISLCLAWNHDRITLKTHLWKRFFLYSTLRTLHGSMIAWALLKKNSGDSSSITGCIHLIVAVLYTCLARQSSFLLLTCIIYIPRLSYWVGLA